MGVSQYVKQEMSRLQEENEALREEVQTLRQYINAIQALMDAIDALDPSTEIMSLLDRILLNALIVINATDGSLLVLDEETTELVFVLSRGTMGEQLIGHRMPSNKGIAGWVVEHRQPTIVNNPRADDRFYAGIDQSLKFVTRSILAAPVSGGGRVLGVVEVVNKRNGQPFNETDQILLTLLCRFAGDFLYRMLEQEEEPGKPAPEEPAVPPAPPPPSID
jgi:GAF domain-containing protein